jgi:TatD DNase family protein
MADFYDTHAHLDFPDFTPDLPQVIERARAAGITRIFSVGTDLRSSRRAIEIAETFPCVQAVVGWHPGHAAEAPDDIRASLRELGLHPKVVALGETGLDYHRPPAGRSPEEAADLLTRHKRKQAELFRQHLEVAAELGLNCVIHQRDSLEDTLAQLQPFADRVRGVFHCFAGDAPTMQRILAMNSMVSFTGIATFKNAQNVRDTLSATPMGKFMLETDSPYLAPVPYRGKRCEPAYVKELSETAAAVKKCSIEELSAATCAAAADFFHPATSARPPAPR